MLVISQDLDELLEISDRMAVMFARPAVAAAPTRPRRSREKIGMLMGGRRETRRRRHMRSCLNGAPSVRSPSRWLSPLIAIALTLVTWASLFALLGKRPLQALYVYFVEPLTDPWSLQEIVVKATPLVLIAVGLSLCYLANIWNIGAEGQFLIGAICGGMARRRRPTAPTPAHWVLPAMLLLGALGGALYALIPALCKVRFGANEILTSLMLVYVADLLLDYLVRGPWRDPKGFNFPTTAEFDPVATVPILIEGSRAASRRADRPARGGWSRGRARAHAAGFEIRVVGAAPRAARFAGFSADRLDRSRPSHLRRARGPCRHHRGRRAGRQLQPASRPATASRRSSSRSSGGSIRSAS